MRLPASPRPTWSFTTRWSISACWRWPAAGARLEFAGKRGGKPSADQADISQRLVALARGGQRVLRLKGGDPFVFGRGGEEAMVLAAAGVPFRVIPGVTAGLAALAAAAIPATLRGVNRAVIFAAGHGADEDFDWAPLARTGQPIVLYMVMHNLERIAAALMAAGLAAQTPAAVIASATTPQQRVLVSTLAELSAAAARAKIRAAGDRRDRRHRDNARRTHGENARRDDPPKDSTVTARGIIIAAPHSGAGKTTVTLARAGGADAARRHCARGESRAGLHRSGVPRRGHGAPSVNLDSWAMPGAARRVSRRRRPTAPISLSSKA
jgi:siroheme synthase